jgi:hypothetical protein
MLLLGDSKKNTLKKKRFLQTYSEIVIEDFPRCSNSFAVETFRIAQNREIEIAT